jgi:amidase
MGGYNPDLQIPINPWDPDRWTGVSSSGSGVATASGQCYGSLGSDTGGSIRFPAAACGTVGLKPTYGRVSRAGVLALADSMDHVGPLTRSTADAAIMLHTIAGSDPRDPTSLPDPVPDYLAHIDDGVAGLRIGFDRDWATERVDPEIVQVVEAAVEIMRSRGAEIVDITMPPVEDVVAEWWDLCSVEAAIAHADTFPSRADEYGPFFRYYLRRGNAIAGTDYVRGHIKRIEFTARLREAFADIDALVCPAMATPAFPITRSFYLDEPKGMQTWRLRFTAPFDMNGAPTITLPAGIHSDGVPLAVQFVGKTLNEDVLFRLGRSYERATDFVPMRPPVD